MQENNALATISFKLVYLEVNAHKIESNIPEKQA